MFTSVYYTNRRRPNITFTISTEINSVYVMETPTKYYLKVNFINIEVGLTTESELLGEKSYLRQTVLSKPTELDR